MERENAWVTGDHGREKVTGDAGRYLDGGAGTAPEGTRPGRKAARKASLSSRTDHVGEKWVRSHWSCGTVRDPARSARRNKSEN